MPISAYGTLNFFFECLQQGNCLKSINLSNENIILTFILMGITSALLKLYMTITTALSNNITLNEISMLKVNIKFTVFQEFFGITVATQSLTTL